LHESDGWNVAREYAMYCANHNIHLDEALQRAKEDYSARPHNIDALDTYAWCLYRVHRATEAKPFIEEAMRMNPLNTSIWYHASLIAGATGDAAMSTELLGRCSYLPCIYTNPALAAK
jgi:tetratricopeptide (TPR) repeat protein